jgi:tetratricopeptide (TPR) repeat protein
MRSTPPKAETTDELASVRHLADLGYVDPLETAARRADVLRAQQSQLDEAVRLLQRGDLLTAIELVEALIRTADDWHAPRRLLAQAYFAAERWAEAEAKLDWLRYNGFEGAELSLMRAKLALRRRCFDDAIEHAEYAIGLESPSPIAELVLGEAFYRKGQLQAAEEAYRRAAALPNYRAAAYTGLTAVALRQGDVENAVEHALAAVELEQRQTSAHYRLGLALAHLGKLTEARVALLAAARLNPAIAGPYRWVATICDRQGDAKTAAEFRRRAREVVQKRRAGRPSSA